MSDRAHDQFSADDVAGTADRDLRRRAEEILRQIDHGEFGHRPESTRTEKRRATKSQPSQLALFPAPKHPIIDIIEKIDTDDLTPRQALMQLYALKEMLNN